VDPLTHLLATRAFFGRDRATLLAGIAPDLAFYSTYPLWVLRRGRVRTVLDGGVWPVPPPWMAQLHRAGHSIPVALLGALLIRIRSGRWPSRVLSAYLLHLLIDIPTHAGAATALALLRHRLRWDRVGRDADPRDSNLAEGGISDEQSASVRASTSWGCCILKDPLGQNNACVDSRGCMMMD